ncbi:multiple sugar-binding transport system multiple sugar-binding protein [Lachnospiraceae bacterium TWA4]|nr:multiple sugar-binding transport system multiple sugar-binding protein [Lachnospiraceae bacterium TWA4]
MKMKKAAALLLTGTMALSMVACSGGGSSTNETKASGSADGGSASKGAIRLLNGKPEINDQLEKMASAYKAATGNEVTIETIGGDTKASDELKKMYQSDNMPDLFVIEANQAADWDGMLVDFNGEAWTDDTEYELKAGDATVGFPYTVESTALAYNADVLDKAGIDVKTLTSPAAYKTAFETLDAKKDELGLTAVLGWCTEPSKLNWSSGTHVFAQYLDAGLAQDDTKYIDMLNDGGKIDKDRMTKYAEFIGLMNQYSDPALLVDGDYDTQVANFASGKYAFVTQGNWIGATVVANENYKANSFKMGMAPYAFEDGQDTVIAGPPSYWVAYKDGQVDAAKAFLQWVSDDEAQKILVEEANLISPFSDCNYAPTDPFYESIKSYMDAGKTSGWHTMLKKPGLETVTGQVYNDYAKGSLDTAKFVDTMEQVIQGYYAQ